MKKYLLLSALVCLTLRFIAQPANDNCFSAISLGTLGAPGACGTGIQNGSVSSLLTTNIGATPSNPYISIVGCGMAQPAYDVWYSFVAPANGSGIKIDVTGAGFANPNIGLYKGSCGSLAGISCTVGSGGAATLSITGGITAGQTYFIQVSGNTGQSGNFTLAVNSFQNCSNCLNAGSLTVSPLPVNGTYQPGQTVSFCFHVDTWSQINTNWLHGVQPAFGSGWDLPTLTTTAPPKYVDTTSGGIWGYFITTFTSSANGTTWPAGFYYDLNHNGNPGDNFGDGITTPSVLTPPPASWNFCWTIKVKTGCNPGLPLSVVVTTSGDGESGSWTNAGCAGDPAVTFSAIINDVAPVVTANASANTVCAGQQVTLSGGGAQSYSWSGGVTDGVAFAPSSTNTYTVTGTDINGCIASATTAVTVNSLPVASIAPPSQLSCASPSTLLDGSASDSGGNISYNWSTSGGNITSGGATNAATIDAAGTYTLTVTDAVTGCYSAANTTVTSNGTLPTAAIMTPSQLTCVTTSVLLDGSASSSGGTISYSWTTSGGNITSGTTGNSATVNMPGSYNLTVTDNGCSTIATVTVLSDTNIPDANAGSSQTITCASPVVTLTGSSASPGVTFSWSPGGTTPTSSSTDVAAGGTYSLTVTDPVNGCVNNSSVTVLTDMAAPVISIGSNSPLCEGQTLNLSSGTNAVSPSYTWSGPNTFNSVLQNPVDTNISIAGAGNYVLTVTDGTNGCSATDSVLVTVNSNTDIAGHLSFVSGNFTNGNIFLIVQGSASALYDTIAVVSPDAGGNYIFAGVPPGNYYVRAEPGMTSIINTYFGNAYLWDSSYVVHHGCLNSDTANITLIQLPAQSGPGSVSGTIFQGSGFGHKIIPGNPVPYANVIPGVPVKVGRNPSGTLVASGSTDTNGVYTFTNLPIDDYTIYVDLPGYPMDSTYHVSITNASDSIVGLNYIVDSNSVYIDMTLSAGSNNIAKYSNALTAFPNPVKDNATFVFEVTENSNVNFELFNLQGEKVATLLNRNFEKGKYNHTINFDQYGITNGTYIIKANVNNTQHIVRLVVMR